MIGPRATSILAPPGAGTGRLVTQVVVASLPFFWKQRPVCMRRSGDQSSASSTMHGSRAVHAGPNAAGDPRPTLARRNLGARAGKTVRHEPAGDLPASESSAKGRPRRARTRGAMAAMPASMPRRPNRRPSGSTTTTSGTAASTGSTAISPKHSRRTGTNVESQSSIAARSADDHHGTRIRGTAGRGIRRLSRHRSAEAVVRAGQLHDHHHRHGFPHRRAVPLHHARTGQQLPKPHHLSRDPARRAPRLSPGDDSDNDDDPKAFEVLRTFAPLGEGRTLLTIRSTFP